MTTDSNSSRLLRVFLCHAFRDKDQVRQLYKQLRTDDFGPWLDEENLLAGQNWRLEIPTAVKHSDVVLVCLSKNSISKSGYVQKEINLALDAAEEQPEGTIYIIPIRLEDCEVPERLSGLQWVNLFEERGYEKLIQSLRYRASTLSQTPKTGPAPVLIQDSAGTPFANLPAQHTVDLAMEMGNQETRILDKTRRILFTEPSIVAINQRTHRIEAIGIDAEGLSTSNDIVLNYPIRDDKIADPDLATKMLQHFFHKVLGTKESLKTRVVVAVPSELTLIERLTEFANELHNPQILDCP